MVEIKACLNCGSKDVNDVPDIWSGYLSGLIKCNRCGYEGGPLIFRTEKEWKGYKSTREKEGFKNIPPQDIPGPKNLRSLFAKMIVVPFALLLITVLLMLALPGVEAFRILVPILIIVMVVGIAIPALWVVKEMIGKWFR